MVVGEIIVRQSEIPAHSPFPAPGVAHDKATLCVVITHREDGVAAADLLVPNWHCSATSVRDFFRVETLVNGEPENEWITGGEASFHLGQRPPDAMVGQAGMLYRFGVTFSPRLLAKFLRPVRPQSLVADAAFCDCFNATADLRAAIGMD
ncbi:MAG: hypothetical protein JWO45_1696 [Spartobacteria bacterium]|nr:hypothetical protein [Spartobacteria bacterium]